MTAVLISQYKWNHKLTEMINKCTPFKTSIKCHFNSLHQIQNHTESIVGYHSQISKSDHDAGILVERMLSEH